MASIAQSLPAAPALPSWKEIIVRLVLSLGLLYCAIATSTRGIAYLYFRQGTPESLAKASSWAPSNPEYYAARARRLQELSLETPPSEIVRLFETAARLAPQDSSKWSELGGAYEWAGQEEEAIVAFRRAVELFPNSPKLNWKVGNFYIRSGRAEEAYAALHRVVEGDPKLRLLTYDLAWRAIGDADAILEYLVPEETQTLFSYLKYLTHSRRYDEADRVWRKIAARNAPFDARHALRYINRLLRERLGTQALRTWRDLQTIHPIFFNRAVTADGNIIENGDFEDPVLGAGFDWLVQRQKFAAMRMDRFTFYSPTHSVRIEFFGKENAEFRHLGKYIPVKPNTPYVFTGYMKTDDITTDSGPRFRIEDAAHPRDLSLLTESLTATNGWAPQILSFRTGPETTLLRLRIVRTRSQKLDNRISGRVWVDRISLREEF